MNNIYKKKKNQEATSRKKLIMAGCAAGAVCLAVIAGSISLLAKNNKDTYTSVSDTDTIETALGSQDEQEIYEQVKGALSKMAETSDSDAIKELITSDMIEKISQQTTSYVLQQIAAEEIDTSGIEAAIYEEMYDELVKELYAQAATAVDSAVSQSDYIEQITNSVIKKVNTTVKSTSTTSGLTKDQVQSMIDLAVANSKSSLETAMKEYLADSGTSSSSGDWVTTSEMRAYISTYMKEVKQGDKGEKGDTGLAGKDAETPVRGVDYYTDADVAAMVNQIAERIEADGNISLSRTLTEADKAAIAAIVQAALNGDGYATTDELIKMIMENENNYLTEIINSINKANGQTLTSNYDASTNTVTFISNTYANSESDSSDKTNSKTDETTGN